MISSCYRIVSVDRDANTYSRLSDVKGQRAEDSVNNRCDLDGICSLLTEAQIVDTCTGDISEKEKSRIKQELQLTRLKQLVNTDNNRFVHLTLYQQ